MTSPMQVPLLDLKPQYATIKAEALSAIARVCDSQGFILGAEVTRLEKDVAAYSQCQFGIGTSSGTDALLLALMALGIGAGDEVITTPYTFFATAGTIARTGARPVFCDIDPVTFNLDPGAVEHFLATQCETRSGVLVNRATGGIIKAIMPVHLYGQVADMQPLLVLARRHGLKVIEDCRPGHRRRRRARPPRLQFRRHRLPVVLPDQEPRRLRRCRHVRHAGCGSGRAHEGAAGARRQAQVLPFPDRRQFPHR